MIRLTPSRPGRYLSLLFAMGLCLWLSVGSIAQSPSPTPSDRPAPSETAQVVLAEQTLFPLADPVGSFSAVERAQTVNQRLAALVRDPEFEIESLKVEADNADGFTIMAAEQPLVSITSLDAKRADATPQLLANRYLQKIRIAIANYRTKDQSQNRLWQGIYAAIATVILLIILGFIGWLFPKLRAKIESWRGTRIRAIKIQKLTLFSEERLTGVLIGSLKLVRQPLILGLFYLYALGVLSIFPGTKALAFRLRDHLLTALNVLWQSFLNYLPSLAILLLITIISYYIIKFVQFILAGIERGIIGFPGFYQEWARPTYQIVRFLIITGAIAVAVPYIPGAGSPALQGISIFLGIFVSLGATAVIANVFAGIALTYTRAFRNGDRVKIADTTGDVVERTFLVTRLNTPKNVVVTIPNSMVLANHIINYSASEDPAGLILHTAITLGYDVPWPQVHDVLIAAALATEHIQTDPSPFVLQTSLDDFYVSYELNAYTQQPAKMTAIYSVLHQNIQDGCNAAGIEILSPHYSAMRDGNHTTIPEHYLSQDYQAPSFRINPLHTVFPLQKPPNQA